MLDIDDFKMVNDTHGHPQGDKVLAQVAGVLRAHSRDIDAPARYGGEEMVVVVPGTDSQGAARLAERMREAIERTQVAGAGAGGAVGDGELRCGVGAGIGFRQGHADRRGRHRAVPSEAGGEEPRGAGRVRTGPAGRVLSASVSSRQMGILDDAIREHLELKRQHGAPEEEVQRQQDEALGPARRDAAPPAEDGDRTVAADGEPEGTRARRGCPGAR